MRVLVPLLAASSLLLPAAAQAPLGKSPGVQWTLRRPSAPAIAADLGRHATFAWCTNEQAAVSSLHSRFDSGAAPALWSLAHQGEPLSSDAAAEGDLFAVITRRNVGGPNDYVFRLDVGSSQGPLWAYDYPAITTGWSWVSVARDGSRVVASFVDAEAGAIALVVFERSSPTPVALWRIAPGSLWAMELSDDATRVALSVELDTVVVDLTTGAELFRHQAGAFDSNRPVALSGDGRTLAFPVGGMQVWRWDGARYAHLFTQPLAGTVKRIALSRDGDTCAWGVSFFTYPDASTEVWTQCLDVPTQSLTMTEVVSSSGTLQNFAVDIELSDDGSVLAVAQAGDEPDVTAEVRVFRRHGDTPTFTLNLTGSAMDVDVSGDGRWVLVASRAEHVSRGVSAGRWDLIHLGGDDIELVGAPHAGSAPVLVVHGEPGQEAHALVAEEGLAVPLAAGRAGELLIGPRPLRRVGLGPIGPDGTATLALDLLGSAALPGRNWSVQSLVGPPALLGSNWLPITVLP